MRSGHLRRYRLACGILAVCLTAAAARAQAGGTKVVVDRSDVGAVEQLQQSGARQVAERERYLVFTAEPQQLPPATAGVRSRPDFDSIQLRRRTLGTRVRLPAGPRLLPKTRGERRLKLVQFAAPPLDADLQALTALGGEIVQYVPQNGYLVWTSDSSAARALESRAAQSPLVQYLDDYDPQDALSPRLDAAIGKTQVVEVTIQLFNDSRQSTADIKEVHRLAHEVGPARSTVHGRYLNLRAKLPGRSLAAVAALPTVVNIEPYVTPQLFGERQGQILAGNLDATKAIPSGPGYLGWLAAGGFSTDPTDYPIVAVVDDGVDNGTVAPTGTELYVQNNPALPSRLMFAVTPPGSATTNANGPDGHGHLNASILAGYNAGSGAAFEDVLGFNYGVGIAPYGRLGNVRIFTPDFDIGDGHDSMVADYFGRGARISSNSWGYDAEGDYDTAAQEYDALTRDALPGTAGNQQLLFVFAAGNDGPAYATVGSPATAKNIVSVGASESADIDAAEGTGCGDTLADGNDARDLAAFSSRGPCVDGRIKPDVVAPGTFIHGAASQPLFNGTGVCGAATNDFVAPGSDALFPPGSAYTWSSGTSHATPVIAAYTALATEYLARTSGISTPSPALLKAYVVNSSRHISGNGANDTLPSPGQGFGLADMSIAFDAGVARLLHDQETVLADSGTAVTFNGAVVDPNQPVRVTLVWTDAPGPTFGDAYANDLDLTLSIGSDTYRGNNFALGLSQIDGTPDARNNVEAIVLPAGPSGAATITVEGLSIVADGVPGNADATDQDFALVAYNFTDVVAAGTITLDSDIYSCADSVTVTVRDSDLAGAGTALAVAATTSGDLEALTLNEAPVGSGIFKHSLPTTTGQLPLPQNGALQTVDGDVITVTYADADNGSGPALVEAGADVDCRPPASTDVSTTAGGTFVHVHVEADEPVSLIVRYGTACNALAGVAQSIIATTVHDLTVAGLLPLTDHFFRVELADSAGNVVVDDNGGTCFAFSTLEPPDYFTELFAAADFDLDHRVVTLTPDSSGNSYSACTASASTFAVDPQGGTVLELADDWSQRIDIGGGAQVPFYGVLRSTLYVNSNGNLTFGAADSDFSESLLDHFALPRVAALFDDLDPGSGGTVSWKQLTDRIAVTFDSVPRFDLGDTNTFQIELFFDGVIRLTYLAIATDEALVGISQGLGLPLDFVGSDLTSYATCSASTGRVLLDAPIYSCTDAITATVEDADLAGGGAAQVVLSATGGDIETVVLAETPAGSGSFVGTLPTAGDSVAAEDGTLQITSTQTITVEYDDTDDGSGEPATRTMTARTLCTDHFTLYKAKVSRDSEPFYKHGPLMLEDELWSASYDVVKPIVLGAPADKNGEDVHDDVTHLQEYKLKLASGAPKFGKVSDIRTISQCGDLYVQAVQPVSLLVPAHIDPVLPVTAPAESEHRIDHFVCYRAKALKKLADGTRVPVVIKGTQAEVADGLQTRRYDLKRVTKLCVPVAKTGTPTYLAGPAKGSPKPITPASVRNPGDRLICYKATLAKKLIPQNGCGPVDPADRGSSIEPPQEKHSPLSNLHVADQLSSGQRNTVREIELCVPSLRTP